MDTQWARLRVKKHRCDRRSPFANSYLLITYFFSELISEKVQASRLSEAQEVGFNVRLRESRRGVGSVHLVAVSVSLSGLASGLQGSSLSVWHRFIPSEPEGDRTLAIPDASLCSRSSRLLRPTR